MPTTMNAVLLLGHGGFEQLVYRSGVQIPAPGPDEVLIQVRAAGVNNTDVNMRIGWYSKSVTGGSRVASRRCIWVRTATAALPYGAPARSCCSHEGTPEDSSTLRRGRGGVRFNPIQPKSR
jgi:hypothetical protein